MGSVSTNIHLEFNDSDLSWFYIGWWLLTEVVYKVLGQRLGLGGDGEDRHSVTGDGATQGLSPEEDLGVVKVLLPESQMSLSKIYRCSYCAQYKHLK